MPEHSVITDPNIHEPKGVASATAGQVYVADGAGSGSWATPASIPTQTNNSGKTLTTDGSSTSWTANNRVLARATVNVAAGTVSNAVNVSSVTGSTTVTVTFTTPLADTNYVAIAIISDSGGITQQGIRVSNKQTTSITFSTYRTTNEAATACDKFDFVIFG